MRVIFFLTLNINLTFDSSKLRYPMYKTVKLVCLFNGLMIGLGRKDEYSSLHAFLLVAFIWGGGPVQETLRGCATNMTWIAKSASWYMNGAFKTCNIWYVNELIFQNLSQNWIKFITSLYLNKIMVYLSHNQCYDYCEYECYLKTTTTTTTTNF